MENLHKKAIYAGNEIKQKTYSLGFIDKNNGTILNKYNVANNASADYVGLNILSGNYDMNLSLYQSNSEVDQKIRTILNWILPTQGNYFYSILDNRNLKSQNLNLDGREISITVYSFGISINFSPIIKCKRWIIRTSHLVCIFEIINPSFKKLQVFQSN